MISWILLGAGFLSLVLVIYWLTEKPKSKVRSEYQLPPRRVCAACAQRFTTNLGGVCTTCLMERS